MSNPEQSGAGEHDPRVLSPAKAPTRAAGAPFTTGAGDEEPLPTPQNGPSPQNRPSPPRGPVPFRPVSAGRALSPPPQTRSQSDRPSAFQRSLGALRMVLPVMQKVLPLLDGNVASVVSNLLAPHPQGRPVDLVPLENALGKMHEEHLELRNSVAEQNTMLKRVGDQIDMVKEATDRNSLGQQELIQDLHTLRKRVNVFGWVGLGLLALSILLNVVLLLRIERILP